eukprot:g781.t1
MVQPMLDSNKSSTSAKTNDRVMEFANSHFDSRILRLLEGAPDNIAEEKNMEHGVDDGVLHGVVVPHEEIESDVLESKEVIPITTVEVSNERKIPRGAARGAACSDLNPPVRRFQHFAESQKAKGIILRDLEVKQKLLVENRSRRDLVKLKYDKITNSLNELRNVKQMLLKTLDALIKRAKTHPGSVDGAEVLQLLEPHIRYVASMSSSSATNKSNETPPPLPILKDCTLSPSEIEVRALLQDLPLPFTTKEMDQLISLISGERGLDLVTRQPRSPLCISTTSPSSVNNDEDDSHRGSKRAPPIRTNTLRHNPAFGSSTPTSRDPRGLYVTSSDRPSRKSAWMGDAVSSSAAAKTSDPANRSVTRRSQRDVHYDLTTKEAPSVSEFRDVDVAAFVRQFTSNEFVRKQTIEDPLSQPMETKRDARDEDVDYDVDDLISHALDDVERMGLGSETRGSASLPPIPRHAATTGSGDKRRSGERAPPPPPPNTPLITGKKTDAFAGETALTSSSSKKTSALREQLKLERAVSRLPIGSIRRDGLKWCSYYIDLDGVEHYGGSFKTEKRAYERYLELSRYYKNRISKSRYTDKHAGIALAISTTMGAGAPQPGSLKPIPKLLVDRAKFLGQKMKDGAYARGGRDLERFLVSMAPPHRREACEKDRKLALGDFVTATQRMSFMTHKEAFHLAKCLLSWEKSSGDGGGDEVGDSESGQGEFKLIGFDALLYFIAGQWPEEGREKGFDNSRSRSSSLRSPTNNQDRCNYASESMLDVEFMDAVCLRQVEDFLFKCRSQVENCTAPSLDGAPSAVLRLVHRIQGEFSRSHRSDMLSLFIEMDMNNDDEVNKFEFRKGLRKSFPHIEALDETYDCVFMLLDVEFRGRLSYRNLDKRLARLGRGPLVEETRVRLRKRDVDALRQKFRLESFTLHGEDVMETYRKMVKVELTSSISYKKRSHRRHDRMTIKDFAMEIRERWDGFTVPAATYLAKQMTSKHEGPFVVDPHIFVDFLNARVELAYAPPRIRYLAIALVDALLQCKHYRGITDFFNACDVHGYGILSSTQLCDTFASLGGVFKDSSREEIGAFVECLDTTGEGTWRLPHLKAAIRSFLPHAARALLLRARASLSERKTSLRNFAVETHLSPYNDGSSFSKGELADIFSALGAFQLAEAGALDSLFRFFCFSEND